jgi:hypothetical protein
MSSATIDVGADFSRFPGGRYRSDGPHSGEGFREDVLVPWLAKHDNVRVMLDTAFGYGSSFLEEAFGGLVRANYPAEEVLRRITVVSEDPLLITEVRDYIEQAGRK